MTGLAYLASVLAVLWLSYWLLETSRNESKQDSKRSSKPRWTPFDYPPDEVSAAKPVEQARQTGWRSRATVTRRRG